ncbi:MAG: N-acetylneuraminate synthase family protein [Deltaproteobacteria bacterium]
MRLHFGRHWVGDGEPTYFIADIAANHDGDIGRAKTLIHLAAEAGADAAKFQNFRVNKIISAVGFASLGKQDSHQAKWKKSVYQVYQQAALPWEWTGILQAECEAAEIDYFSTPYDFEAVDMLDPYVAVFKIGSGDIIWPEMLQKVAQKGKPVILSTGASDIGEVQRAVTGIQAINPQIVLMQCNTNYTGKNENFNHIHLRVLHTYRALFPDVVLGLSDHTSGIVTVLGAVSLGARVMEKHFTDDPTREGPDHPFSMTPSNWREMVERTRELEAALGTDIKQVEENERETVIVQRRCLRAERDLSAGIVLRRELIEVLRPAPADAIFPYEMDRVWGMRLRKDLAAGDYLRWSLLEPSE